jgi:arabinofuranosyltransferase
MESRALNYPLWLQAALVAAFVALGSYMMLGAWVAEDAYISFRVIDNFMNGYGLRWNSYERVQVYTHPLWLLLHIPLYALWHNLFLVTIGLSISCALLALLLTLFSHRASPWISAGALLAPYALSKSLMDYSTSGLENPLSFALFALFGFVLLQRYRHPYFWFYVSLTIALALLNRLDTLLLYAPALAYVTLARWREIRWKQVIAGALPLIAWFLFAFFYYGFFLPNTKYAKLNTDLDFSLYLNQGVIYANQLLMLDTPGLVMILASLGFLFSRRWLIIPALPLPALPRTIAAGILCYCLYVFCVGGDYMAGRFWALPVFASLWLWYMFCARCERLDFAFTGLCVVLAAAIVAPMLRDINKNCDNCIPTEGKIMNASWTFGANKLVASRKPLQIRREGTYSFAQRGRKLATQDPPPTQKMWYIGMIGFYAGPKVKIIDELGLADPLLSRLPAAKKQHFYIAHFRRDIPKGYIKAIQTDSLKEMNSDLAHYYAKLRLIVAGDLWDVERLKTILRFNMGYYDQYRQRYLDIRTP